MNDLRAQLRAFALSLPVAAADLPWGERVIKVNGKIFVFLRHDEEMAPPLMTVKLNESHGHAHARGSRTFGTRPRTCGMVNIRIVAPKRLVGELDRGTR
jgi:hypothetical protein